MCIRDSLRSAPITFAPRLESNSAVFFPIPEADPVTTYVRLIVDTSLYANGVSERTPDPDPGKDNDRFQTDQHRRLRRRGPWVAIRPARRGPSPALRADQGIVRVSMGPRRWRCGGGPPSRPAAVQLGAPGSGSADPRDVAWPRAPQPIESGPSSSTRSSSRRSVAPRWRGRWGCHRLQTASGTVSPGTTPEPDRTKAFGWRLRQALASSVARARPPAVVIGQVPRMHLAARPTAKPDRLGRFP